jgi:hypothetical protein
MTCIIHVVGCASPDPSVAWYSIAVMGTTFEKPSRTPPPGSDDSVLPSLSETPPLSPPVSPPLPTMRASKKLALLSAAVTSDPLITCCSVWSGPIGLFPWVWRDAEVMSAFLTLNLDPKPYTPHPTPYTLHPTPYTLHPTPYTLIPDPTWSDSTKVLSIADFPHPAGPATTNAPCPPPNRSLHSRFKGLDIRV